MLPPTTPWPPNFFTPRRRPAESRPLRDEPPAFLCAMVPDPYFLSALGAACLAGAFLVAAALAGAALAAGFSAAASHLGAAFLAGALVTGGAASPAASALGAAFLAGALTPSPTARMRSRAICWRWPFLRR